MTAAVGTAIGTAVGTARRTAGLRRRGPELGAVLVAAAAWLAMLVLPAGQGGHAGHGIAGSIDAGAGGLTAAMAMWALMCAAMMLPSALPAVRHVAANSLRWRRGRAVAQFAAAYLAVWIAFGGVVLPLRQLLTERATATTVLAGTLGAAAVWHVLPYRRRFVRDCHRGVPLRPRGWAANLSCLRFGVRHGRACIGSCWPSMLVMAAVPAAPLLWMIVLATAVTTAKWQPDNEWAGSPLGVAFAGLALLAAIGP